MNKNFEQAYRELAQTEAPDLWDRIEASLTSKSAPGNLDINIDANKDIDLFGNTDTNEDSNIKRNADTERNVDSKRNADLDISAESDINVERKVSSKIWIFVRKYAGVAAAILCAAIILPVASLIKNAGDKSFSGAATEEITADQAIEESAVDTAMTEEAALAEEAAEPEDAAFAAGAANDMSLGSGADSGGAENAEMSMADARSEAEAADEMEMSGSEGGAKIDEDDLSAKASNVEKQQASGGEETKKIEDMGSAVSEEAMPLPEGTILEGIVVEVASAADGAVRESEEGTAGSVYMVAVKEDTSGRLSKDSEIEVFVPAHASFALSVGETYRIDIVYTGEGKYPVVQKSERAAN